MNLAVVVPTWPAPEAARAARSGTLSLLLVNVQADNARHGEVARAIRESNADLVGVVELTPTWASGLNAALEAFPHRMTSPEEGAYGIGLYSKVGFENAAVERFPRDGPASIVVRFVVGGQPFTLVLTHVHTPFAGEIHRRQFEAIADARERLGPRLAVCGDLNAVPWSSSFRHLASAAELTDSHRGHWLEASWPTWGKLIRVPLDNCLYGDGVTVVERAYGGDVGSDHLPLSIRFGITELD